MVGRVWARLLADLTQVTGLESAFVDALEPTRQRSGGHAPGRVAVDLAVMLADGGEAIADLTVPRDQPEVFGQVASDPTARRVLKSRITTSARRTRPRIAEHWPRAKHLAEAFERLAHLPRPLTC